MSLYFVNVSLFICSNNLYSSVVDSSSPAIHSEVDENITEANWFNWGSCGSKASKLEVEVDKVGPFFGDVSGRSMFVGEHLLFSIFEDLIYSILCLKLGFLQKNSNSEML